MAEENKIGTGSVFSRGLESRMTCVALVHHARVASQRLAKVEPKKKEEKKESKRKKIKKPGGKMASDSESTSALNTRLQKKC